MNKSFKEEIKLMIEATNKRFDDMNKRLKDEIKLVIEVTNKRFEDMNKRFEDMNKRFDFLTKLIVGFNVPILLCLFGLLLRVLLKT